MPKRIASQLDSRIHPYTDVIMHLLIAWYRILCFTNTPAEWQRVYEVGYEHMCTLIDKMDWDLDNVEESHQMRTE